MDRDEDDTQSLDWRGRPSKPSQHGGMPAALFVLGLSLSLYLSLHHHRSTTTTAFCFIYIYLIFD